MWGSKILAGLVLMYSLSQPIIAFDKEVNKLDIKTKGIILEDKLNNKEKDEGLKDNGYKMNVSSFYTDEEAYQLEERISKETVTTDLTGQPKVINFIGNVVEIEVPVFEVIHESGYEFIQKKGNDGRFHDGEINVKDANTGEIVYEGYLKKEKTIDLGEGNKKTIFKGEEKLPDIHHKKFKYKCEIYDKYDEDARLGVKQTLWESECSDGVDNDGDGLLDKDDDGCLTNGVYNPKDNSEFTFPPSSDQIKIYRAENYCGTLVLYSNEEVYEKSSKIFETIKNGKENYSSLGISYIYFLDKKGGHTAGVGRHVALFKSLYDGILVYNHGGDILDTIYHELAHAIYKKIIQENRDYSNLWGDLYKDLEDKNLFYWDYALKNEGEGFAVEYAAYKLNKNPKQPQYLKDLFQKIDKSLESQCKK